MIAYVETNFVLELAFQQEQRDACEEILRLSGIGAVQLVIPAYCLVEPHEKLKRQVTERRRLQESLDLELQQLLRTADFQPRINSIQELSNLIVQSSYVQRKRFDRYREQVLAIAEIIPLSREILAAASRSETLCTLEPQDAIVYASILAHLTSRTESSCCFLNRNSKDFDNPKIVDELKQHQCRMISRFDDGCKFIESNIHK